MHFFTLNIVGFFFFFLSGYEGYRVVYSVESQGKFLNAEIETEIPTVDEVFASTCLEKISIVQENKYFTSIKNWDVSLILTILTYGCQLHKLCVMYVIASFVLELNISRCESAENYDQLKYPNKPEDLTLKEDLCHFEIKQAVALEHYDEIEKVIKERYELDTSKCEELHASNIFVKISLS